jgi:hypothetical protein
VTCVRAALEACHNRISACKNVYDLAFSLIAPLEAEYNIKFHIFMSVFDLFD